jgi:hypothetical protein
VVSDFDQGRRIGSGRFRFGAYEPSPEWFPQRVTPENFVHYWNDVDGDHRRRLARHWLTMGFDSERLRWLAALDDQSAELLTTDQIVAVLHLLKVSFETPAEFMSRCARAIAKVQVDLDATGFAQYEMQPANACAAADGLPAVYAALPNGNWQPSGSPMEQVVDDEGLVLIAAESVTDTLAELERVFWPTCLDHGGPPMTLAHQRPDSAPAWCCDRGSHVVAPLGNLTARDIQPS